MLALGIRYLNGFVVATEPDSYDRVEWPPHPGRVFMALAAAHFHSGASPQERAALTWLESLDQAPWVRAGGYAERSWVKRFVPVNDKAGPSKASLQSAPLTRDRQERAFPQASLECDTAYVVWPDAEPPSSIEQSLERLCAKVSRLGHSSSLVQMWVAHRSEATEPNWKPDAERPVIHLRVMNSGTLAELERRYNQRGIDEYAALTVTSEDDSNKQAQKEARQHLKTRFPGGPPPRLRPELTDYKGYAPAGIENQSAARTGTVFNPHPIVVTLEREDGPFRHLDLLAAPGVAQRWREAILSQSDDLPPHIREILSGHERGGACLGSPHLAFLPFGFVGHPHADGRLLGMALVLPDRLSSDDRRLVLRAAGRVRRLALGRLGLWNLVGQTAAHPTWNLMPETWTAHPKGATHWSTVTPIVFDRHPKSDEPASYQQEVATMIATACAHIGLPRPRDVIATPVSAHLGTPASHAFKKLRRKDTSERRHSHAILVFDEPVCGPILLGAGRYRGYGVCRPIRISEALAR
ncbi:MAG: type I-U CRISPR-associated protein Cas5/Cas6 [Acidobacteria bacterium]|nr:type I-U CRISPR-associated protein Cas5/Cas6 [Acidobacteriota bacterium]